MAARIDGAVCTTTCISGSARASQTALGAALLEEGGRGADVDALAALDADRVVHVGQVGRADDGVEPAAVLAQVVDALDLGADPDAAAAEDALLGVADDRVAGVLDREVACARPSKCRARTPIE